MGLFPTNCGRETSISTWLVPSAGHGTAAGGETVREHRGRHHAAAGHARGRRPRVGDCRGAISATAAVDAAHQPRARSEFAAAEGRGGGRRGQGSVHERSHLAAETLAAGQQAAVTFRAPDRVTAWHGAYPCAATTRGSACSSGRDKPRSVQPLTVRPVLSVHQLLYLWLTRFVSLTATT